MFNPRYRITKPIAIALKDIESDLASVASLPLTAPMLDSLRRSARLLSTHFSTQIEGNRLTLAQINVVIEGEGTFPGRERDEAEVRHYYTALEYVERLGGKPDDLSEREIRTIHGLVMTGRAKPTPYRKGQNVIRDVRSGRTVYLPPEAKDVPTLMADLVEWVNGWITSGTRPVPVVAALAHYRFATIHPYFDGNGRTARLLTNLILHRNGYGSNGLYSLEEYYAKNLDGYYAGLTAGKSHNYYFGRAEASVTRFVNYFCVGMADAFATVRTRAEEANLKNPFDQSPLLRELSAQQRSACSLFLRSRDITKNDLAVFFKLPARQAYLLCARWLRDGFLVVGNPSTKARSYRLAKKYEAMIQAHLRKTN